MRWEHHLVDCSNKRQRAKSELCNLHCTVVLKFYIHLVFYYQAETIYQLQPDDAIFCTSKLSPILVAAILLIQHQVIVVF